MHVGIIGCGYWGSKHVRVFNGIPEVERTVAIDFREDRRAALAQTFPALETAASLDDVIDGLDAVVVATPPSTHASIAMQALEAGKHVMVEKPLAKTSEDAQRLVIAAERNGLTLMVGHTFEHNAAVWKLRELVVAGTLGKVLYIDTARLNLGLYQPNTNVIWDLAPHDVSIINHILDAKPVSVQAWGSRHVHAFLEDVAYLKLTYPNGVDAHVHVSWLDPCKVRRVTVVGDKQMAVYNDLASEERVRVYDKGIGAIEDGEQLHEAPKSYRYGGITSPYINFQEPLAIEDSDFVRSIIEGKAPVSHGRRGLAVVQALVAAERSLRDERPVLLEEPELAAAG